VDVADKVDKAQARFAKLGEVQTRREPTDVSAAAVQFIDYLTALAEGRERVISTGLRDLDDLTAGGIRPGDLWVIGGRPSMGKTALTLTLARNMGQEYGTLFLSQEMPVNQLTARHMAALGRINLADLRQPAKAPQEMWDRVTEAAEKLRHLNLVMDDQGGLSLLDVRRKVMGTKRRHGCDVVVVDYLQLMTGDGENRNQELDRISNGLKALALEFGVGVVLLSQLSRKADERSGPPVMSDLRDSGAIEAAADLIAMIYRDFVRSKDPETKYHAQLEVVKQRAGPSGTVHLLFNGEHQRIADWPKGDPIPRKSMARSSALSGGME
jgi:replicative DNA helicase